MSEPDLIQQAIQALKAGEQARAQGVLSQLLAADPENDRAWLLLAACLDDAEKKRYCLQRVLAIRPDDVQARQALDELDRIFPPRSNENPQTVEMAASVAEPADQAKEEPGATLPPNRVGKPQPVEVAAPVAKPVGGTPAPKVEAGPHPAKRSGFNRGQTCLVTLLALLMLAAVAALALIVFQGQGIGLPAVGSQPTQAPASPPQVTVFQLPATWTPLPLASPLPPGPTLAWTPTSGSFQTPLPSLTPIASDRLIVIGRSVQNRPIEVYRFGSGPKERMIVAGIHGGDEGNTIALADELIAYLRRNRQLVPSGYTLYILRSLNPDGEVLGNVPEGRLNGNGVDLNRNFDVGWKANWNSNGCSSLPGTGGSGPGSEPETQALKAFLLSRQVEVLINYHSAYLGVFPSGEPPHPESTRLAQAIHDITSYPYPPVRNGCEYTGTLVDWAASNGVLAAVDVELNSGVDTEFETNLKVIELLLSFEPQAPPSALPPSPSVTISSTLTESPAVTQAVSPTLTLTPTLRISPTP